MTKIQKKAKRQKSALQALISTLLTLLTTSLSQAQVQTWVNLLPKNITLTKYDSMEFPLQFYTRDFTPIKVLDSKTAGLNITYNDGRPDLNKTFRRDVNIPECEEQAGNFQAISNLTFLQICGKEENRVLVKYKYTEIDWRIVKFDLKKMVDTKDPNLNLSRCTWISPSANVRSFFFVCASNTGKPGEQDPTKLYYDLYVTYVELDLMTGETVSFNVTKKFEQNENEGIPGLRLKVGTFRDPKALNNETVFFLAQPITRDIAPIGGGVGNLENRKMRVWLMKFNFDDHNFSENWFYQKEDICADFSIPDYKQILRIETNGENLFIIGYRQDQDDKRYYVDGFTCRLKHNRKSEDSSLKPLLTCPKIARELVIFNNFNQLNSSSLRYNVYNNRLHGALPLLQNGNRAQRQDYVMGIALYHFTAISKKSQNSKFSEISDFSDFLKFGAVQEYSSYLVYTASNLESPSEMIRITSVVKAISYETRFNYVEQVKMIDGNVVHIGEKYTQFSLHTIFDGGFDFKTKFDFPEKGAGGRNSYHFYQGTDIWDPKTVKAPPPYYLHYLANKSISTTRFGLRSVAIKLRDDAKQGDDLRMDLETSLNGRFMEVNSFEGKIMNFEGKENFTKYGEQEIEMMEGDGGLISFVTNYRCNAPMFEARFAEEYDENARLEIYDQGWLKAVFTTPCFRLDSWRSAYLGNQTFFYIRDVELEWRVDQCFHLFPEQRVGCKNLLTNRYIDGDEFIHAETFISSGDRVLVVVFSFTSREQKPQKTMTKFYFYNFNTKHSSERIIEGRIFDIAVTNTEFSRFTLKFSLQKADTPYQWSFNSEFYASPPEGPETILSAYSPKKRAYHRFNTGIYGFLSYTNHAKSQGLFFMLSINKEIQVEIPCPLELNNPDFYLGRSFVHFLSSVNRQQDQNIIYSYFLNPLMAIYPSRVAKDCWIARLAD
jgi:hypothetical protein